LVLLPVAMLLMATWALRPVEQHLAIPRADRDQLVRLGGSGAMGVMGGLRAAVAGGCWLRVNQAWERQDATKTRIRLQLTVAADDRPLYFWLNGARMLAYDLPSWDDAPGLPEAARRKARADGAGEAQAFLEQGLRSHPQSALLMIEIANIRLRAAGDRQGAAEWLGRAAEQPGAPYYAARIRAELLRELGRSREALAVLREIVPGLPAEDPAAGRAVVLQRIKALEAEWGKK